MAADAETRFPPPRQFPRSTRIRSQAGDGHPIRTLHVDDYPLVEIVTDHLLGGYWLYLHPDQNGAEVPRFLARGTQETLHRTCRDMLSSFYARTSPPVTNPPAGVAYVYTAQDHIRE